MNDINPKVPQTIEEWAQAYKELVEHVQLLRRYAMTDKAIIYALLVDVGSSVTYPTEYIEQIQQVRPATIAKLEDGKLTISFSESLDEAIARQVEEAKQQTMEIMQSGNQRVLPLDDEK